MINSTEATSFAFNCSVTLVDGHQVDLPISIGSNLFVVGANGSGKSGLMHNLYQRNLNCSVRISAHRQTWMHSNFVTLSPQDQVQNELGLKSQDAQPDARYVDHNSHLRSGLIIARIINANNQLYKAAFNALALHDCDKAEALAKTLPAIEEINDIFDVSGIPINLLIDGDHAIFACKRGCIPYSVAALSDGERAALLIAGQVITARTNSLIIIDEPERHLHASIVNPLLLYLFSKRPDCAFVISTHELALPIACPNAHTVVIRDCIVKDGIVSEWDLHVLNAQEDVDDVTKRDILGARRKILYVEGGPQSLDVQLYELLFSNVTIIPKGSCSEVERSVRSVRDSKSLVWVEAFGIVDQDQIENDKRSELEAAGIFPLSVYSVEGLYYCDIIIQEIAIRQSQLIDKNANDLIYQAHEAFIEKIQNQADYLSARIIEQSVKTELAKKMPDWRMIKSQKKIEISVDAEEKYQNEIDHLNSLIHNKNIQEIIKRYPVHKTGALEAMARALQFNHRISFEAAARKLIREDDNIKQSLLSYFGPLVRELN